MKTKFYIFLFFVIIRSSFNSSAQTTSCCSTSSTQQFAMLGNEKNFGAAHLSPLPFRFEPAKGKMISIKTKDGKNASGFEVKADKPTNNVLIVFHEWWGLNDYIKQEAEKLQTELVNVNVIALDLYDGKVAANPDSAGAFMKAAKEERIRSIINGTIEYVGSKANILTIGWCYGGGWSLQASIAAGKQGGGCVMYYGMPEKDEAKIKSLNAPVLGIFASKDAWITPKVADQFSADKKKNGKEIMVKMFETDHAFANPSNPKYDKESAKQAHELAL